MEDEILIDNSKKCDYVMLRKNKIEDKKWIDNLKKGDYVIIRGNRIADDIGVFKKRTKYFIVLNYGKKFRKSDYKHVDSSPWNYSWIEEATPEKIREIKERNERYKNIRFLESVRYDLISNDKLSKIVEIIKS